MKKIKKLYSYIKEMEDDELDIKISFEFCSELIIQIGLGESDVEGEVLSIVENIAYRGADMVLRLENNKFFEIFNSSGLLIRVKEMLISQSQQEVIKLKEPKQYSQLFSKLMIIYSFMNKDQVIDKELHRSCTNYFKFRINNLHKKLKEQTRLDIQKDKEQEEQDIKQERDMKEELIMIKALHSLSEDFSNTCLFVEYSEIHKNLVQLIHINCSIELKCPKCMNIPQSNINLQILSSIYGILAEFAWIIENVKHFILNNHKAYEHILPHIISFTFEHSHQISKINNFHSQQSSYETKPQLSNLTVLSGTLNLFYSLLYDNHDLYQIVKSTTALEQSLLKMTQFDMKEHINQQNYKLISQIIYWSNRNLNLIRENGDQNTQDRFIRKYQFIQIQIETIGIGGGSYNWSRNMIRQGIGIINDIFTDFYQGNKHFHALPSLIVVSNEILEEKGGNEEVDSALFHNGSLKDDNIIEFALAAKEKLINAYISLTIAYQ